MDSESWPDTVQLHHSMGDGVGTSRETGKAVPHEPKAGGLLAAMEESVVSPVTSALKCTFTPVRLLVGKKQCVLPPCLVWHYKRHSVGVGDKAWPGVTASGISVLPL